MKSLTFICAIRTEKFYSPTYLQHPILSVLQPEKGLQERWPKRPVMNDKERMLRYIMKVTTNIYF